MKSFEISSNKGVKSFREKIDYTILYFLVLFQTNVKNFKSTGNIEIGILHVGDNKISEAALFRKQKKSQKCAKVINYFV
jgi:hypothetical protein